MGATACANMALTSIGVVNILAMTPISPFTAIDLPIALLHEAPPIY